MKSGVTPFGLVASHRWWGATGTAFVVVCAAAGIAIGGAAEKEKPEFDHGTHWAAGAVECGGCHTALTDSLPRLASMPPAKVCASCHLEDEPAAWFPVPSSHGPDRTLQHTRIPNFDRADCAVCHRLSPSCTECHHAPEDGYLVPKNAWLEAGHGKTTASQALDCKACHDLAEDCADCHLRTKVEPTSHLRPQWDADHIRYGNAVDSCVICHGPPARVCTTCHG